MVVLAPWVTDTELRSGLTHHTPGTEEQQSPVAAVTGLIVQPHSLPRALAQTDVGICPEGWQGLLAKHFYPSVHVLLTSPTHLPRGIHLGKCHLHFFFSHVQVKVLLPVLADVRA